MQKKFTKVQNLLEKEKGKSLFLFNVVSGKLLELNSTSSLLWKNTKESFTAENLKQIITVNCSNINGLDRGVKKFIDLAIKNNLIEND